MGVRGGYAVYGYKGWYWVEYHRKEHEPQALGLGMAHWMPQDPVAFREWLEKTRDEFQRELDEEGLDDTKPDGFRPDADYRSSYNWIRRGAPGQSDGWTYMIDLDHLVFAVNSQPFFRLDHMPDDDLFLESLSIDAYGREAPYQSLPNEYWPVLTCNDLPVPEKDLKYYFEHATGQHPLPVHELLHVSETTRTRDSVWASFLAAVIGQYLKSYEAHKTTLWLGTYGQRERVPVEVATAVHQLVSVALSHPVIAKEDAHTINIDHPFDLNWFRADVFSYFATQLQEEQHRYATIAQVVRSVRQANKRGIVFGVICSLLHIVILRISVQAESVAFAQTPVMQFCPGQYPTSACTPGIAALARLSSLPDPSFMVRKPENLKEHPGIFTSPIRDQRCPTEVWIAIAQHLFQARDLIALGCTSRQCQSAVAEILRDLAFPGLRLTGCMTTNWDAPLPAQSEEETLRRQSYDWTGCLKEQPGFVHPRLYHTAFTAVDEQGRPRVVHVSDEGSADDIERELDWHGFLLAERDTCIYELGCTIGTSHPCYFYNDIYQ